MKKGDREENANVTSLIYYMHLFLHACRAPVINGLSVSLSACLS